MNLWTQGLPAKIFRLKIFKLNAFYLLMSFAFILYYQQVGMYRYKLIVYHLLLMQTLLASMFGMGFILSFLKGQIKYLMYGLLWTAFTLFLIFVYSVIWLEKIYLHLPLSFKVVWVYVLRLKGTVESFDLNYNWVLTGIIILIGIFISLFTLLSKSLLIEMIDFRRQIIPEANRYTINRPDRRWKIVALTLTMVVPLILLSLKSSPMTRLLNNMDPMVELAFAKDSIGNISNQVEPLSIREEYSNNKLLSKPNIILIMVDALRADYLPMYGYHQNTTPFLNQLYQEGKLDKIDYAFSASANSFHGILSTLRSKAAHKISFTNFSVQELLHDQGYRTHFIISGDHTYFYGLKLLYGVSVDYYFDGTTAKAYSVNDDQLIFEGLNPLPSYPLKPSFFYLHLMSAHQLGKKYLENELATTDSTTEVLNPFTFQERYKIGIHQADGYIKRILDTLEHKGYLDSALVIITGEHGEGQGEHQTYGHSQNLYNESIHIPILIYQVGKRIKPDNSNPALAQDLAATMVDYLGLPIPESWEGQSLFKKHNKDFSFHVEGDRYSIISYQDSIMLKYSFDNKSKREELYNITNDYAEKHNLMHNARFDSDLNRLRIIMKEFVKESSR